MSWPKGTLIVCRDNKPDRSEINAVSDLHLLTEGAYYTVAEWAPGCWFDDGYDSIRVAELSPPGSEGYWSAWRFRLAEGGTCEAERARQMKSDEVRK